MIPSLHFDDGVLGAPNQVKCASSLQEDRRLVMASRMHAFGRTGTLLGAPNKRCSRRLRANPGFGVGGQTS